MEQGFKNVAQRLVNAEANFIAAVESRGFTKEQAAKVLAVYRKAKVIKLDAIHGVYSVKHGAFWDVEVLNRAIAA